MRHRLHPILLFIAATLPFAASANTSGLYVTPADALPGTQVAIAGQSPDEPITLTANEMGMDDKNNIVIARGKVEVMQGAAIVMADQIIYYQRTDMVVAEGNVSMLQANGDVYFSDKVELKDTMKRGVIHEFKARFADNSVLVASEAIKSNSSVTTLKKASYTPCNLCSNAAPFWQMNAEEATVDNIDERITYKNGFMEMFGIPMLYTPYLSHPTPDAQAKSGLMTPSYGSNIYFGSMVKLPYYWRISEDKDVLLTPWLTSSEGPLLQWDYKQLRNKGDYRFQGSITYPQRLNDEGAHIDGHEMRGHISAQGTEALSENTRLGFDIQRATDDTYLRRYSFGDQQVLFSNAYYEYAQGRNLGLINALAIQGMRSTDSAETTPLVLPIFQGYYETLPFSSGLKLHISGDAQQLLRQEGVDQRRLSITPGATLPFITDNGHIFTATVNLRQDFYSTDDHVLSNGTNYNGTTARTLPQAALEWRYPLINHLEGDSWLIEPVMLGVFQKSGGNPEEIANEDNNLLELSDTNLFSLNRMPGLDLVDAGSRLAYGIRSEYYSKTGIGFNGMLGQNYSLTGDTPFPNSTRAGEQFSDYIGRVTANYSPFSLTYRFALDNQDAALNRNEISFGFGRPWLSLSTSYRSLKNNRYLPDSREGQVNATMPVDDNWSFYGGARRDVELNQMVNANGGIIYKNECFNIIFDALRVYARDRDITPSTEFTFRVGFKNLGEFGGQ